MGKQIKKLIKIKKSKQDSFYEENLKFAEEIYRKFNLRNKTFNLPKKKQSHCEIDPKGNQCLICFLQYSPSNFTMLKCGHEICTNCYIKWKQIKNECPYCRRSIIDIAHKTYDKYSIANITNDDWRYLSHMFNKGY